MDDREHRPLDVPRSPTGRVPQWVLDEATGRSRPVTPWRAGPPVLGPPPPRRRSRWRTVGVVLAVAGVVAGAVWVGGPLVPALQQHAVASAGRPDAPTPGHEEQDSPLGTPAAVQVPSPSHRWMATEADGSPVRWDPCRPVHLTVRPTGEPVGAGDLLARALSVVSAASGLRFVVDPPTDEPGSGTRAAFLPDRYGDRWAPVLVVWETAQEQPDFAGSRAGQAGPRGVGSSDGRQFWVSGQVELSVASFAAILGQQGGVADAVAVISHELGHLVGLAHVDDPTQLMFGDNVGLQQFGPGDLTGLAELGRGPCAPDL